MQVQFEISKALRARKPVILLHETDDRHGKFDFAEVGRAPAVATSAVAAVPDGEDDADLLLPEQLTALTASHESIGWDSRGRWSYSGAA